jgi:hypothetical protein
MPSQNSPTHCVAVDFQDLAIAVYGFVLEYQPRLVGRIFCLAIGKLIA